MLGKARRGRKRMELLDDMTEGRDYGQLKDLISDRSRWRQDSKRVCMTETCWKQQKTKERCEFTKWPKTIKKFLCDILVNLTHEELHKILAVNIH